MVGGREIRTVLGYVTKAEAKRLGMTHHGRYFFIPVWMADVESDAPQVLEKFLPLGRCMEAIHVVEGLLHSLFWPDAEPVFQFHVLGEIK